MSLAGGAILVMLSHYKIATYQHYKFITFNTDCQIKIMLILDHQYYRHFHRNN